ncbi:N-acetyltransferase [Collibacillus ludicampi]|jgi:L-amino acid N-acyltransferase YncA|uniref:N-acetyltransferase n=1 Tax=Collibacillus ludicampi TaxID=2771369 RepID=A0AAV4LJJ5_9BACL|nr:GNAT family N-acetyltransferase [Collibacillus ludicampi]GIM47978.1 N-acetyltransferase [Collibacillus ludicampi]
MIRFAREEDLEGILEIYNDAILNTTAVYAYKPHTLENRKQWFLKKKQEGYPIIVYDDSSIAGFATYGPFRAWPAYKYTIEHSVYVHKDYRNKGVGKLLVQEIIRLANKQNYATLVAGIDSTNVASIKLHEGLGFTFAGTIRKAGFKFGKWLDLSFYQKELVGPKMPTEE